MAPEPNPQRALRSRVGVDGRDVPVVDYLAQRFRYQTVSQWRDEIAARRVLVGDDIAATTTRLRPGDTVTWLRQVVEPWVDDRIDVLHEDADLLVVHKPAHLPMHADGPFVNSTLVQLLRDRRREPGLGLVHRLDRETSGVAVLARTPAARKAMQAMFEAGAVAKRYVAVVHGAAPDAWLIDAPIGRAAGSEVTLRRTCGADAEAPKSAATRCRRLTAGGGRSLVQCWPQTGRTHQIRVHLAHSGHPIVGDKIYGQPDAVYLAFVAAVKASGDPRTASGCQPHRHLLHADELAFRHPTTGRDEAFRCPAPDEFAKWLADAPPAR
ncbi:MAG: RluA family pseudouridine synthase [Planctomycetes bacterium]|nr:RluA family pseudouridine synthase [Planctomycetota bacterium]